MNPITVAQVGMSAANLLGGILGGGGEKKKRSPSPTYRSLAQIRQERLLREELTKRQNEARQAKEQDAKNAAGALVNRMRQKAPPPGGFGA